MNKTFTKALKVSLPVFFGYIAIGIAFGLMLVQKGYPWWLSPVMSLFIFAGAGQYVAVGLFAAGTPLSMIIFAELLVNIRHIVYGLSLITKFQNIGKWKYYIIFGLTDETYSLLTTTDVPEGSKAGPFYFFIAVLDHSYWILGSIIGAVAGALIPFDFSGVDFALTALFVVLLIDQIEKTKDLLPPVVGSLVTIGAIILWRYGVFADANNILLIALALGIAVITLLRTRTANPKNKTENKEGTK